LKKKRAFFKHALKTMRTSGMLIPSSRFLVKKMLQNIDFSKADIIVELGPGNGAFTHQILKQLHPKALLICFEIDPHFYNYLAEINNPQLIVLNSSAENIIVELKKINITKVDYIISSLPLTFIPKQTSKIILENSFNVLIKKGIFVQYQYSLTYYKKLKEVFKNHIVLDFEILNVPPAFIFKCIK